MRFIRVAIIANWKLYPIPRHADVKYRPHRQFLKETTVSSSLTNLNSHQTLVTLWFRTTWLIIVSRTFQTVHNTMSKLRMTKLVLNRNFWPWRLENQRVPGYRENSSVWFEETTSDGPHSSPDILSASFLSASFSLWSVSRPNNIPTIKLINN